MPVRGGVKKRRSKGFARRVSAGGTAPLPLTIKQTNALTTLNPAPPPGSSASKPPSQSEDGEPAQKKAVMASMSKGYQPAIKAQPNIGTSAAKSKSTFARPVPDFKKLHQKWTNQLEAGKAMTKKPATKPSAFDFAKKSAAASQQQQPLKAGANPHQSPPIKPFRVGGREVGLKDKKLSADNDKHVKKDHPSNHHQPQHPPPPPSNKQSKSDDGSSQKKILKRDQDNAEFAFEEDKEALQSILMNRGLEEDDEDHEQSENAENQPPVIRPSIYYRGEQPKSTMLTSISSNIFAKPALGPSIVGNCSSTSSSATSVFTTKNAPKSPYQRPSIYYRPPPSEQKGLFGGLKGGRSPPRCPASAAKKLGPAQRIHRNEYGEEILITSTKKSRVPPPDFKNGETENLSPTTAGSWSNVLQMAKKSQMESPYLHERDAGSKIQTGNVCAGDPAKRSIDFNDDEDDAEETSPVRRKALHRFNVIAGDDLDEIENMLQLEIKKLHERKERKRVAAHRRKQEQEVQERQRKLEAEKLAEEEERSRRALYDQKPLTPKEMQFEKEQSAAEREFMKANSVRSLIVPPPPNWEDDEDDEAEGDDLKVTNDESDERRLGESGSREDRSESSSAKDPSTEELAEERHSEDVALVNAQLNQLQRQMNLIYKQINNLAEVKEKYADPHRPARKREEEDEFNFVFPGLTSIAENSQQKLMNQIQQMTEQMNDLKAQMKMMQSVEGPSQEISQPSLQPPTEHLPQQLQHQSPQLPLVGRPLTHPQPTQLQRTIGSEKTQGDIFRPFDAPPPSKIECVEDRSFSSESLPSRSNMPQRPLQQQRQQAHQHPSQQSPGASLFGGGAFFFPPPPTSLFKVPSVSLTSDLSDEVLDLSKPTISAVNGNVGAFYRPDNPSIPSNSCNPFSPASPFPRSLNEISPSVPLLSFSPSASVSLSAASTQYANSLSESFNQMFSPPPPPSPYASASPVYALDGGRNLTISSSPSTFFTLPSPLPSTPPQTTKVLDTSACKGDVDPSSSLFSPPQLKGSPKVSPSVLRPVPAKSVPAAPTSSVLYYHRGEEEATMNRGTTADTNAGKVPEKPALDQRDNVLSAFHKFQSLVGTSASTSTSLAVSSTAIACPSTPTASVSVPSPIYESPEISTLTRTPLYKRSPSTAVITDMGPDGRANPIPDNFSPSPPISADTSLDAPTKNEENTSNANALAVSTDEPQAKGEPIVNLASFIQTLADAESQVVNPLAHVFDSHKDLALLPPPPSGSSDPSNSAFMHRREDSSRDGGFPDPPVSSFSLDSYEDEDPDRHSRRGVLDDEDRELEDGEIDEDEDFDDEEEEDTTPRKNKNITPKRRQFNVSESMYKSVLVHSASKRFQESLMEEMRKEDEMGEAVSDLHQQQREAEALDRAVLAEKSEDELPEELVDSLGMISLANAAELHRGKESEEARMFEMASAADAREQPQRQQHPLPPASTLLNLNTSFVGPENVFSSSTITTSASGTTTTCFANPIEVVVSNVTDTVSGDEVDSQQNLVAQMAHLANYSYAIGNMPSTAFDYLRLYDSQILNNSTSTADGSGNHGQDTFPADDFYDFQS